MKLRKDKFGNTIRFLLVTPLDKANNSGLSKESRIVAEFHGEVGEELAKSWRRVGEDF